MNKSIKIRQTKFINWIIGLFPEAEISYASTGSVYINIYNKVIRLSDHVTKTPTLIQVIFNPLNTAVQVIHMNSNLANVFTFSESKIAVYMLLQHNLKTSIPNEPGILEANVKDTTKLEEPEKADKHSVDSEKADLPLMTLTEFMHKLNNSDIDKATKKGILDYLKSASMSKTGFSSEKAWKKRVRKKVAQKVKFWYYNLL